jgi:hypothetical protein
MGRYAFFSTGVEYKFHFGVQPSSDIARFGGNFTAQNKEFGYSTHTWEDSDQEQIKARLEDLIAWIGEEHPLFEEFPKTREGTYELKGALDLLYKADAPAEIISEYILGCLIYHQLLYSEVLVADYEG